MIEFSYVHIPFCAQKCRYCAFVSFVNLNLIDNYIQSLLFQIEKEYDKTPQKTLYIGGGTPSLLKVNQIKQIVDEFVFTENPEITMEINPENADLNYLKGLFEIGINRLSIGIQTFNDEILKLTGRRHFAKDSIQAIKNAKLAGFKNISIDLIYGLPEETKEIWEKDLEIANSLDIEHISTYGLKIEENTYFNKFKPKNLPDEDLQAEMYELSIKKLNNFHLYEISNFCKNKSFQSLHNLNYWNLEGYNAFGISASGFDIKTRYKNTSNIKKYLENPLLKEEIIETTKEGLLEETIFLGFRKTEGINKEKINQKFKTDFDTKYKNQIKKYIETGHLIKTENGYKLSLKGILISNCILCDFLC